ncbi:uncharacterized protein BXZ73DRAFT_107149 [Epithele typhae]|uniref:uncharacterized protein n=1 Tax=Epithele typhae TaxID=378194 RepID=UPI0020081ACF|nr:uncharacterized protein BXZ73DRAFT_107149 [Epithele typhae]KAH9912913.1 hypothetical protein BXZ73DRAFT_107149 [Epithele typhae]
MNHSVHEEAEGMFAMREETIALTLKEKLLFEQGDQGVSFGGTRDVPEFVNISKDDTHAWPAVARRTYPSAVNARMDSTITPSGPLASLHKVEEFRAPPYPGPQETTFLTAPTDFGSLVFPPRSDQWFCVKPLPGHATCNIGDALNIVSGGILRSNIHRVVKPSTNGTRSCSSPPNDFVELRVLSGQSERIAAAVAYAPPGKYAPGVTAMEWLARRVKSQRVTNCKLKLSGLWPQMHPLFRAPPEQNYARPVPSHAIGDALTILSGGFLRSNLHRIVPPGEQLTLVQMATLADQSAIISDTVAHATPNLREIFDLAWTSHEWLTRWMKDMPINNQKVMQGTDGVVWNASPGGTEHERIGRLSILHHGVAQCSTQSSSSHVIIFQL